MLDITILKTAHGGNDRRQAELRARKLIPYVQSCDVFSIESALVTEETARLIERTWAGVISSPKISCQEFSEGAEYFVKQEQNATIRAYLRKAYEYAFRNKRPLYYAERWADESKASLIGSLWGIGYDKLLAGLVAVASGDESAFRACYEGSSSMHGFVKGRDINVGENFARAEAVIRENYPQLEKKNPILLCVQIGAVHKPEIFSPLKVNDSVFVNDDYDFNEQDQIDEMMWTDAPFEAYIPLFRKMASDLRL
ncbi:MAG: hypothetical protein J4400_02860 [Candidatus Aenigmarchaeota archaeon]|nr:hypothetical protein [Candidatus Aenigmarchaeota archaeon]